MKILGKYLTSKNRLDILKHTGSLIESPSYYDHLTGRENLNLVCMLKQAPETEIDRVLHIVRLENQQHKKVGQYSLGMKQRLGLASAMIGSIAHSVVLLKLPEGADVAAVAADIEANMDPRKWICVEAEATMVKTSGQYVLMAMSSQATVDAISANFDTVFGA